MFKVKFFSPRAACAALGISLTLLYTIGAVDSLKAQQNNPGVQQSGAVTSGHGVAWGPGVGQIQDGGAIPSVPVTSVFGRIGAVVATAGDYSFSLISGSLSNSQLDTVNANVGAFGGVNSIPSFTVNAQGRITAAAANVPAIPFTELTGSLACGQTPAYTGDTTKASGSCVTSTVKVNGIAFAATAAIDTVPVTTTANTTSTYTALPNCTTGALNYSTTTHLFSCAAAGSGTVTSAAVVQGTGGITVTGTCSTTTALNCTVNQNPTESYCSGTLVGAAANAGTMAVCKTVVAVTVDNIVAMTGLPTAASNVEFVIKDCGTAANACGSPTSTIGTVTASTSNNTAADGTVSTAAVAAGHYIQIMLSTGSITTSDYSVTVAMH